MANSPGVTVTAPSYNSSVFGKVTKTYPIVHSGSSSTTNPDQTPTYVPKSYVIYQNDLDNRTVVTVTENMVVLHEISSADGVNIMLMCASSATYKNIYPVNIVSIENTLQISGLEFLLVSSNSGSTWDYYEISLINSVNIAKLPEGTVISAANIKASGMSYVNDNNIRIHYSIERCWSNKIPAVVFVSYSDYYITTDFGKTFQIYHGTSNIASYITASGLDMVHITSSPSCDLYETPSNQTVMYSCLQTNYVNTWGGYDKYLFASYDYGVTWTKLSSSLYGYTIDLLTACNNGMLFCYAATSTHGRSNNGTFFLLNPDTGIATVNTGLDDFGNEINGSWSDLFTYSSGDFIWCADVPESITVDGSTTTYVNGFFNTKTFTKMSTIPLISGYKVGTSMWQTSTNGTFLWVISPTQIGIAKCVGSVVSEYYVTLPLSPGGYATNISLYNNYVSYISINGDNTFDCVKKLTLDYETIVNTNQISVLGSTLKDNILGTHQYTYTNSVSNDISNIIYDTSALIQCTYYGSSGGTSGVAVYNEEENTVSIPSNHVFTETNNYAIGGTMFSLKQTPSMLIYEYFYPYTNVDILQYIDKTSDNIITKPLNVSPATAFRVITDNTRIIVSYMVNYGSAFEYRIYNTEDDFKSNIFTVKDITIPNFYNWYLNDIKDNKLYLVNYTYSAVTVYEIDIISNTITNTFSTIDTGNVVLYSVKIINDKLYMIGYNYNSDTNNEELCTIVMDINDGSYNLYSSVDAFPESAISYDISGRYEPSGSISNDRILFAVSGIVYEFDKNSNSYTKYSEYTIERVPQSRRYYATAITSSPKGDVYIVASPNGWV